MEKESKSDNKTLGSFVGHHYDGLIKELDFSQINMDKTPYCTAKRPPKHMNGSRCQNIGA